MVVVVTATASVQRWWQAERRRQRLAAAHTPSAPRCSYLARLFRDRNNLLPHLHASTFYVGVRVDVGPHPLLRSNSRTVILPRRTSSLGPASSTLHSFARYQVAALFQITYRFNLLRVILSNQAAAAQTNSLSPDDIDILPAVLRVVSPSGSMSLDV